MVLEFLRGRRGSAALLLLVVQLLGSGWLPLLHAWDLTHPPASVIADEPGAPSTPSHEHTDCHACKVAGLQALAALEPPLLAAPASDQDPELRPTRRAPHASAVQSGGGPRAPPA